jgi:serine/threonine protein kinase
MKYKELRFFQNGIMLDSPLYRNIADFMNGYIELCDSSSVFEVLSNQPITTGSFNTVYFIQGRKINGKVINTENLYVIKFWNDYKDNSGYEKEIDNYKRIHSLLHKQPKSKYRKRLLKASRIIFYGSVITSSRRFPYYIIQYLGLNIEHLRTKIAACITINKNNYILGLIKQIKEQYELLLKTGYIHCDVKAENILVKYNNRKKLDIYLIDFSNVITISEYRNEIPLTTISVLPPEGYLSILRIRPKNYITFGIIDFIYRILNNKATYSYTLSRKLYKNEIFKNEIYKYYVSTDIDDNWSAKGIYHIFTIFYMECYFYCYHILEYAIEEIRKLPPDTPFLSIKDKLTPEILFGEFIDYPVNKTYIISLLSEIKIVRKLLDNFNKNINNIREKVFPQTTDITLRQLLNKIHEVNLKTPEIYKITDLKMIMSTLFKFDEVNQNIFIGIIFYLGRFIYKDRVIFSSEQNIIKK